MVRKRVEKHSVKLISNDAAIHPCDNITLRGGGGLNGKTGGRTEKLCDYTRSEDEVHAFTDTDLYPTPPDVDRSTVCEFMAYTKFSNCSHRCAEEGLECAYAQDNKR